MTHDPRSPDDVQHIVQQAQRKVDRVLGIAFGVILSTAALVLAAPSAYQLYMLSSATDNWFHIKEFKVYDDDDDGQQRFFIDRTVNTVDPLIVTIMWTVKDATNNEVLCERELFTAWEKTDVIDSVIRNVVRTCEDAPSWVGRSIKIQGRFTVILHYGIRKEQIVTSNPFVYTGK